jgi:hypothetical protein
MGLFQAKNRWFGFDIHGLIHAFAALTAPG